MSGRFNFEESDTKTLERGDDIDLALQYRHWRARILAANEWLIQGGRGEQGRSLEGMQIFMISRKWDLKEDQEASMSDDRMDS